MMSFLGNIMGHLLRFVYNIVAGAFGSEPESFSYLAIAIIISTIIFKLILLPININQFKSQQKMAEIQPKLKELQVKYKNDPQTLARKQQEVYKEENYNPFSGCLPLLIQFPIIIALFSVFREPAKYAFKDPGMYDAMNKAFFWVKDLDKVDVWGFPILVAVTTFLQSKTMMVQPKGTENDQMAATQNIMTFVMPIMLFFFSRKVAAALSLYWVVGNIFTIIQQLIMNRGKREA